MHRELSTPLTELPTFLSTISMVTDDRSAIVNKLEKAERKSPSVYEPTRALFLAVIQGKMTYEQAVKQAWRLPDDTEKKCATQILDAAQSFLAESTPANVALLPHMTYALPNGLQLDVAPLWIRQLAAERLMILHLWQNPLLGRQLSAAAAVLRQCLSAQQPQYASCEIDFLSIPLPEETNRRRFERYDWAKLNPLSPSELDKFWKHFLTAWAEYQRKGPREIRRRRGKTLFD